MDAITRRGVAILVAILVTLVALGLGSRAMGLKYVQGLLWPTDLPTFVRLPVDQPIDVAILGSSRASFDLPPSAVDRCLATTLQRPTRTVNLARAYANAATLSSVAKDLLRGPRKPTILLLAVEAETLDANNPENAGYFAYQQEMEGMAGSLFRARTLGQVYASFRPLVRGAESLALLLTRRMDVEARLRWMMTHHGGGQYCFGTEACARNNRDVEYSVRDGWDTAERIQLPALAEERFGHYNPTGWNVDALEDLFDWAEHEGIQVVLLDVPLHARWMEAMPKDVHDRYRTVLEDIHARRSIPLYEANTPKRQLDRRDYVDADHLGPLAAEELSNEVCTDLLAPLLRR